MIAASTRDGVREALVDALRQAADVFERESSSEVVQAVRAERAQADAEPRLDFVEEVIVRVKRAGTAAATLTGWRGAGAVAFAAWRASSPVLDTSDPQAGAEVEGRARAPATARAGSGERLQGTGRARSLVRRRPARPDRTSRPEAGEEPPRSMRAAGP